MNRRPQIEIVRERHEAARLQLETKRMERALQVLAKYDATESSRARRQPVRETQHEGEIYNMSRRLLGCNLGRDLERNYSPAKGILHQMRVNVVGSLGKMQINVEDKAAETAEQWFNGEWAKDCDFRDDVDWSTVLQNVLASEIRDGDVLLVVDDNLTEDDTGKILTWESDQVAPVEAKLLESDPKFADYRKSKQDNGILRDEWGRILAYIATGKRGLTLLGDPADVTIWKRADARLARNPWRLNQGRGIPSLLTPSTNFIDLYEILAAELATTKRGAKQYAFVKRSDAVTDYDSPTTHPEFLPENDGRTAADVAADGANQATQTARNYERLETFTGGMTDYLAPEDAVEFPKVDHPNSELAAFLEAVHGYGGAALGLARAYTILRADSSYTAFRGDMILSWVTFEWLQKHIERVAADWIGVRVLRWAQRKKKVPVLPAGWERAISWTWPTMPEVDELDAQNAIAAALKNGTTDYSKLLGPDWKKRLTDFGNMVDFIRTIKLPLKILETASGGPVENPKKDAAPPGGGNA